jgi:hypothetical protein
MIYFAALVTWIVLLFPPHTESPKRTEKSNFHIFDAGELSTKEKKKENFFLSTTEDFFLRPRVINFPLRRDSGMFLTLVRPTNALLIIY